MTHKKTAEKASLVERLKSFGSTDEQIAAFLDIDNDTLQKYYKKEIREGKTKTILELGGKLVSQAKQGDTACLIFYLKTQGGWREKIDVNNSFTLPAIEAESIKKSDD